MWVLAIYCRVHIVHIFLIQLIPQKLDRLSKTLEMDDLPLTQELDDIIHIRVIADAHSRVFPPPRQGRLPLYGPQNTAQTPGP